MAVVSGVEVLADGESHDKQRDQLGDDHGCENLNAHTFLQAPLVYQSLGRHAQT